MIKFCDKIPGVSIKILVENFLGRNGLRKIKRNRLKNIFKWILCCELSGRADTWTLAIFKETEEDMAIQMWGYLQEALFDGSRHWTRSRWQETSWQDRVRSKTYLHRAKISRRFYRTFRTSLSKIRSITKLVDLRNISGESYIRWNTSHSANYWKTLKV